MIAKVKDGKILQWIDCELTPTHEALGFIELDVELETKEDGSYYPHYLADGTRDIETETLETITQAKEDMNNAIQAMLDDKAKEYRWDDMKSARAGAIPINETDTDVVKAMKTNANNLTNWYYEVWGKASEIEEQVAKNLRVMPTKDELLAEMPVFGG